MNAAELRDHVTEQVTGARRTLAEHHTEAYTGVCRSCGRPGACDEQLAARARLAHYGDPVDNLRDAWVATIAAADRAGARLHGAGPPGRRLPWQDAVTECWRALSLVYAGLSAARTTPGNPLAGPPPAGYAADPLTGEPAAGSAGELLAGLRAAHADADRAAVLAATVRWRLGAAEDRLRHTGAPADRVAARPFRAAVARLDLVAARLAVGARSIDRYAAALAGTPQPAPPVRPATAPTNKITDGVRAASRLVGARRRREHPGLWTTVRLDLRREWRW